jgi:hypothetical protein
MSKAQTVNFKTPKGMIKWPRLDQPYSWSDTLSKNVPDAEGQFETKLVVSKKDAQPLIQLIQETIKDSGIKPKNLPFKEEMDKDTNEPTGNIEFTLKRYGKDTQGAPNKIAYFDSRGSMIKPIGLTTGSMAVLAGWIKVSKMAARLNLKAIQVVKLQERMEGFDPIEDDDAFIADNEEENKSTEFDDQEEANIGRPNF